MCNCGSIHTSARQRSTPPGGTRTIKARGKRKDPTRTKTLRREYEAELAKRWRRVIKAIVREVGKRNGFGVVTNARFEFTTDSAKVAAFEAWVSEQINKALFKGDLSKSFDEAAGRFWGNTFANRAYRKGMIQSVADIRRAGGRVAPSYIDDALKRGFHAEALDQLYRRQYEDLKNISDEMSKQMGEVLAEGLSEGKGPYELADALNDRVEKIGITRSRLLARTEIISAFGESQLNVFEDAGVQGVQLEPELLTAGDDRVCEECEDAARQSYTVATARGVIPLHPNCRCAWAPLIVNGKSIELA